MTSIDYGYGDAQPDYGYGDAQPDYGYGDAQPDYDYGPTKAVAEPDYGYGDTQPDYGYGDAAKPEYGYGEATPDYGYGETKPDYGYGESKPDYGYGDSKPDYGYGDSAPVSEERAAAAPARKRQTKRRCSVTKYSLEAAAQDSGSAEAEMVQQLHAAETLQRFRNGGAVPEQHPMVQQAQAQPSHDHGLGKHSSHHQSHHHHDHGNHHADPQPETAPVKRGMFNKIKKRLSVAF